MKTVLFSAALVACAFPLLAQNNAKPPAAVDELQAACHDTPVPAAFDAEAYAVDGDTVAAVGVAAQIRLWGLQAPELRDKDKQETMPGMVARAALEDLLDAAAHKMHVAPVRWDRDCRLVVVITTLPATMPDGTFAPTPRVPVDVGLAMLSKGFAWGFALDDATPGHPALSQTYAHTESQARATSEGLWPFWLGEGKR